MGLISKFAQIDRKFSWSFMGFVLAAIFGGVAIYTEFFRDTNPILKFEILSNTRILDVKEDVGGLSVIYNDIDIKKLNKTLSVLALRISNLGRSAVLKGYYDDSSPLGFSINNGQIIKSEIIGATTNYLKNNVFINKESEKSVMFSDVIIEPGESYTCKFLILHQEQNFISITPSGKIAGVKNIEVIDQLSGDKAESYWLKVVSGSFWVQVARLPTYFFGFFISIFLIVGPIAFLTDSFEKRKKRKTIIQFNKYTKSKYEELNKKIYSFFRSHSLERLLFLRNIVSDEEKLKGVFSKYKALQHNGEKDDLEEDYEPFIHVVAGSSPYERRRIERSRTIIKDLIDLNIIDESDEGVEVNKMNLKAMNEFIDFVAIKHS